MKESISSLKWLIKGFNKKGYVSLLLFILLGLFQGVGIVLLIPMLSLTGMKNSMLGDESSLVRNARFFLDYCHIPITFLSVLMLFLGIIFLYSLLKYRSTLLNSSISQDFSNKLRKQLHHAIMETEWISIIKIRSSDMVGMLSREISQISFGITTLTQLIGGLILLFTNIFVALWISPKITFFVLGTASVLFIIQRKLFASSLENGKRNMRFLKLLQSNLQEHFQNIKLAKSQNLNEDQKKSLDKISDEMYENQLAFTATKAKSDFSYDVGAAVMICVFLYVTFVVFSEPILDLVLLMYVFSRILPGFKSLFTQIQTLLNIVPIIADIKNKIALFEEQKEQVGREEVALVELKEQIELKEVVFQYTDDKVILNRSSITIPSGKITAITGNSGSGKSTLADLLTGLLKPESGKILIDGKELPEIGYKNWRNSIAYMTQERFLFHDSIRNNLLWSKADASEEEIWHALEQANAKEYILQLPKGIDTVVGDRGIRLSGGQRQRIALAMALIRKPSLLILDEATNELDEANEKEIYETIFKLKDQMTIFIITHRLSSMKMADQAWEMKDGKFHPWAE
jgi:ATP-binding cassette subfamily C protein